MKREKEIEGKEKKCTYIYIYTIIRMNIKVAKKIKIK